MPHMCQVLGGRLSLDSERHSKPSSLDIHVGCLQSSGHRACLVGEEDGSTVSPPHLGSAGSAVTPSARGQWGLSDQLLQCSRQELCSLLFVMLLASPRRRGNLGTWGIPQANAVSL